MNIRIGIVGTGALAQAVSLRWREAGIEVAQVWGRSPERAAQLAARVGAAAIDALSQFDPQLDAVVIAISDDAIAEVSAQLASSASPATLYVHCSGATPLSAIDAVGRSHAVIWPIQSFARDLPTDWTDVPVVVETDSGHGAVIPLAKALSPAVITVSGPQRQRMHLAATLANNFANALLAEAAELVNDLRLDHRLFLPSLRTLLARQATLPPRETQSGPARRGDHRAMQAHLELLAGLAPDLVPVYEILSRRIARRIA